MPMKKLSTIILIIVNIFAFVGCSAKGNATNNTSNITPNSDAGKLTTAKSGTYDIKHKSTKDGYEEAVVTIKDGKFENIELKRLDKKEKEVDYNQWDGTKYGYPNLKQYRLDLAKAMIDKRSANVDVITGATESSNGWKAAVDAAISKAQ
jgi:major membrane immunogen (membrane-anchored lipoprotein)